MNSKDIKNEMHLIEVDDRIFKYLQSQAESFIDTPISILYRLLLDEKFSPPKSISPVKNFTTSEI
jgi:negative regulator of replication initiation